jgi:hypothetical protein
LNLRDRPKPGGDYRFDSHFLCIRPRLCPLSKKKNSIPSHDTSIFRIVQLFSRTVFHFRVFVTSLEVPEEKIDLAFLRSWRRLLLLLMKNKNLMAVLLHSYVTCGSFNMLHGAYITDEYLLQYTLRKKKKEKNRLISLCYSSIIHQISFFHFQCVAFVRR